MSQNPFLWLILTALDIYFWIIVIWVVASWLIAFNVINPHNSFVRQLLYGLSRAVEPVLGRIRRFLPDMGGLDLSPMIALLGVIFLQKLIIWAYSNYLV